MTAEGSMPRTRRSCLVVAVVALLPYLLLPAKPLVYDAYPTIVANQAVQSGPLLELFALDFWGMPPEGVSLRSYRPLVSLTYALQARVVGTTASVYHVTDMLLHAGTSVLLLMLMVNLGLARRWAVPAVLLFAVHPVQTDAVCSAVGRADILAACGLLGALILHLRAPHRPRPMVWHGATLLLLGASLLCKEYAVSFPFILMLTDLARRRSASSSANERRRQARVWIGAVVLVGGYILLRQSLFGEVGGVPMLPADHPLAGRSISIRWLTAFALFTLGARLLVLPYALNHHYRFGTLQVVESLGDWRALLGAVLVLGFSAAAAVWWWRRRDAIPVVALGLIVLPLAPSLNTVSVAGVLFAERFLYIPVAGLALLVAWALDKFAPGIIGRRLVTATFGVILVVFGALTARRVEAWGSLEQLARTSIAAYPGGSEAWKQLGATLAEQNRNEEAIDVLERSVELNPGDPAAWKVLADVRTALGRHDEAAKAWRRLVELSPARSAVVFREAGAAELRAGDATAAVELLRRAESSMPQDPRTTSLLAQALFFAGLSAAEAGDTEVARHAFGEALLRDPDLLRAKHDRAIRLIAEGQLDAAIVELRQVLLATPDHVPSLFNLARALALSGSRDEAISVLERGLQLKEDARARQLLEDLRGD